MYKPDRQRVAARDILKGNSDNIGLEMYGIIRPSITARWIADASPRKRKADTTTFVSSTVCITGFRDNIGD